MKRLLLSAAVAMAAIGLLTPLGHGPLAGPPLGSLDALTQWLADRDAVTAAFACTRLVGLVVAWYLLVVTTLAACARVTGWRRLARVAERVAHPTVRRLLVTATGAGLLSTALVGPTPAGAEPAPPDTAVMVLLDDGGSPRVDPTTTMTLLEEEPPSPAPPAPEPQPDAPAPTTPAAPAAPAAPTGNTYVVEPGDCFWSIAEDTLSEVWGRPPTDGEIVAYWRPFIERNRERLVDRDNPDLLYPGQSLELPPVPG